MIMTTKGKIVMIVLAVMTLLAGAAGFVFGRYYIDNKEPNFSEKYVLYVYPDMEISAVIDSLYVGAGTIRPKSVERTFAKMEVAQKIKPGRYVVDAGCTSIYVARMLVFGWQTPQNMTLSGTLRKKDRIAQRIGSQMLVDSAAVADALNDEVFLSQYGFTPENVFALILPDTYEMYWTASVKDIFDRFKKEYDAFWTDERKAKAKAQGLSQMEVSVMASIVSGETLKDFEFPIIAGAYLNRYKKGMKLQADPTIAFCYDYTLDRILKKHLTVDSPYNTYKHVGLPPAPINVPSKACLDAVLNPAKHNYIYFCANPNFDGTHRFAATYTEHLKNAREFHKALTARRKAQAAAK